MDNADRPGTLHDDALSKRTEFGGVPFSDMAALNEDTRIMVIGRAALAKGGQKIMFFVDSDLSGNEYVGKADRYVRKIKERFPTLIVAPTKSPTELVSAFHVYPKDLKISRKEFFS